MRANSIHALQHVKQSDVLSAVVLALGNDRHPLEELVEEAAEVQHAQLFGLPLWPFAVLLSITASVCTVVGFYLQKKGAASPQSHWCIGHCVLSKAWILGLMLIIVADFPMAIATYALAPMSLTVPLSGITVVLNMLLAPYLQGEKFQSWPDLPATFMIVIGSLLTTASASHEEPLYTPNVMIGLASDPIFWLVLAADLTLVVYCVSAMSNRGTELATSAQRRSSNPSVKEMLLPAAAAGGFGLLSNVALKAVGLLLRSGKSYTDISLWLVATAFPAALQLNYLNLGLQLYPQTVFVPIYEASLMVCSTVGGAVFYREFVGMLAYSTMSFLVGVATIAGGIGLFTLRSPGSCSEGEESTKKAANRLTSSPG